MFHVRSGMHLEPFLARSSHHVLALSYKKDAVRSLNILNKILRNHSWPHLFLCIAIWQSAALLCKITHDVVLYEPHVLLQENDYWHSQQDMVKLVNNWYSCIHCTCSFSAAVSALLTQRHHYFRMIIVRIAKPYTLCKVKQNHHNM